MGNEQSNELLAVGGPLNKALIPIRGAFCYWDWSDDTRRYYDEVYDNHKVTRATEEDFRENDIPLNEEEIKIVRRILPYRIPASKNNLKRYVNEYENVLQERLNETESIESEASRNLEDVYKRYNEELDALTNLVKETLPIKYDYEYYKEYSEELDTFLKKALSKLKELKI